MTDTIEIRFKRGPASRLPVDAPEGEPLFTTDDDKPNIYVGKGPGTPPVKVTGVTEEIQAAIDMKANAADLGTAAAKDVPASGNATAGQVVLGSDTRLSNSRTPNAHKSSHATGGGDALTPENIGAATAEQGTKADSALQPTGNGSLLTGITSSQVGAAAVEGFYPETYGAKGDGVTDDTTAIQAALNAAAAVKKPVILDAKSYVANGLQLSSYSYIRGTGWGSKLVHTTGPYCITGTGGIQFVKLENFAIAPSANASAIYGVYFNNCNRWEIDHIQITGYTGTGTGLGALGGAGVGLSECWIGNIQSGCNITGNRIGVVMYGTANGVLSINVVENILETNAYAGVYLKGVYCVSIKGCTMESVGAMEYGVCVETGTAVTIQGNYFENIAQACVYAYNSVYVNGLNINGGNFFYGSLLYDVDIYGGENVTIEGNKFASDAATANIHARGGGYNRHLNIGVNAVPDPYAGTWLIADTPLTYSTRVWRPTNYNNQWADVTFQNAWVNYGGSLATAQYNLADGIVTLRGLVKSGASGTVIFTLPAGYRPLKSEIFAAAGDSASPNKITVGLDGVVTATTLGAGGTYISLSGIRFSTM